MNSQFQNFHKQRDGHFLEQQNYWFAFAHGFCGMITENLQFGMTFGWVFICFHVFVRCFIVLNGECGSGRPDACGTILENAESAEPS